MCRNGDICSSIKRKPAQPPDGVLSIAAAIF